MLIGNQRFCVTGGAGFIGSHLVELLLTEHQAVRVLEKPDTDVSHLPEDQIEVVFADLRDPEAVEAAVVGCKTVLHLAANPNLWARDPDEFEQVNHQGTRRVLGDDHPSTLNSVNNLAILYYAQGRYEEAEPLARELVDRTPLQAKEYARGKRLLDMIEEALSVMSQGAEIWESDG